MKFGILDNSRIFVVFFAKETRIIRHTQDTLSLFGTSYLKNKTVQISCILLRFICDSSFGEAERRSVFLYFINSNFVDTMPKETKFANDAQGADNARTSQRKREIPSLNLKRQLKHLKTMIRTERNHKLRAYSFILDNNIFDCYSHYCMTTLSDSIPNEFIEIMDIMSLKTDPTLLKNDALWKS